MEPMNRTSKAARNRLIAIVWFLAAAVWLIAGISDGSLYAIPIGVVFLILGFLFLESSRKLNNPDDNP
jgi:hypothetical protein